MGKIAEARAALAKNIYDASTADYKDSFAKMKDEMDKIPNGKFLNFGFFIEDGKVFVNTDEYYFSCAHGNFLPGEIPLQLIKDDMRAKLDLSDRSCN